MAKSELLTDYDEYFARQEDVKPEWRAFMEPAIAKSEDEVFTFIVGTILL